MLTLAISVLLDEAANRAYKITGGDDGLQFEMGPVLGLFRFDLWGKTAYLYALAVLFVWFIVAWKHGAFAVRPLARRHPPEPAAHARIGTPVWWRLVAIYAISGRHGRHRGRAVGADHAFRRPQHARHPDLRHRRRDAGARRHAAALRAFLGAAIYVVVQDYAAKVNPFYWMFVIGALLMATVLFLENGLMGSDG